PDRPITPAVTSPPSDDAPGLARQRLFGAVLGLLTELAAASPVLLILEDMHWADDSTLDLVTFLSRVLGHERVAMVVSYRTDDLHRQHPLRPPARRCGAQPAHQASRQQPVLRGGAAGRRGRPGSRSRRGRRGSRSRQ